MHEAAGTGYRIRLRILLGGLPLVLSVGRYLVHAWIGASGIVRVELSGEGSNRRCHADWGTHVNALDCRSFCALLGGLTDRWGRVGGLIFLLFGTLSLTIAAERMFYALAA